MHAGVVLNPPGRADNFPQEREKQFGSFLLSPVAVLMALGC